MTRIRPARDEDAAAIAAIYNQGIAERAATFETTPRSVDDILQRLAHSPQYPLVVATEHDDTVVGWAGLGAYRARDCYAGIGEFSVYLDAGARHRGIGRQLLRALIELARDRGYWKLVSRIF